MKSPPEDSYLARRFAPTALMLGNIVTGCSVLAPAGMLSKLSSGLGVTIRDAGLLITFGAITALMLTGVTGWALSAGIYPLMACSVAIWGLGFASTNSMQQVAVLGTLQRERDHVGSEQRPEIRVFVVALGRDFDVNLVALAGVVADERKTGIAAAKFA
jgi:predicted MFS family arabinose efflux permease